MQVYVMVANNSSDFNETDIVVVGKTREAAERQLATVIVERWNEQLNQDDKDFYENIEKYADAWRSNWTVCGLAE